VRAREAARRAEYRVRHRSPVADHSAQTEPPRRGSPGRQELSVCAPGQHHERPKVPVLHKKAARGLAFHWGGKEERRNPLLKG
jgi:hypothetical protein